MTDVFEDQRRFMTACDQTVGNYNKDQFDLYVNLIKEEVSELHEAISIEDRVEQLDALLDIIVVAVGAIHSLGVYEHNAWREVSNTNDAKVDPTTGKVRKREDGKVLKPDGWSPPNLEQFVKRD